MEAIVKLIVAVIALALFLSVIFLLIRPSDIIGFAVQIFPMKLMKGAYLSLGNWLGLLGQMLFIASNAPSISSAWTPRTIEYTGLLQDLPSLLGTRIIAYWNILRYGDEDPLVRENTLMELFIVKVDGENLTETFLELNETYNFTAVLVNKTDDIAEYVNLNDWADFGSLGDFNGTIHVYYSDWFLYESGKDKSPVATYCYVSPSQRNAPKDNGQASGFFNAFTEEQEWEESWLDELYDWFASMGLSFSDTDGTCDVALTACGYLTKSMVCCEDKVIICLVRT